MLADVVDLLRCPACRSDLSMRAGAVNCGRGHSYDVARQGYVNLMLATGRRSARGDSAAMVDARSEFLGRGHYSRLAKAVAEEAAQAAGSVARGCVVDVGGGTGYYLTRILDEAPERVGLALDASKYSARRAARAHARIGAVVCDAWGEFPVHSESAAVAMSVFAPRNPSELHRILLPEGRLIVVTPTEDHLADFVVTAGLVTVDELKDRRLDEKLGSHFSLLRRTRLEFSMSLQRDDAEALAAMGPSAWHLDTHELRRRLATLPDPLDVEASVALSVYEPR